MGSIDGNRGIENVFCMDQRKLEDYFGYTLEDFKKSQEDDTILPPKLPFPEKTIQGTEV